MYAGRALLLKFDYIYIYIYIFIVKYDVLVDLIHSLVRQSIKMFGLSVLITQFSVFITYNLKMVGPLVKSLFDKQ